MGPGAPSLGEGGTAKKLPDSDAGPALVYRGRRSVATTERQLSLAVDLGKYTNHALSSIWPHGQEVDDIGPVLASAQPIPELRNVFPFKALVVPLEGHGQGRESSQGHPYRPDAA
jgi:hypothetical protein